MSIGLTPSDINPDHLVKGHHLQSSAPELIDKADNQTVTSMCKVKTNRL